MTWPVIKELESIDNKEIPSSPEHIAAAEQRFANNAPIRSFNDAFGEPTPAFILNPKNPFATQEKAKHIYDYMIACELLPTPFSDSLDYEREQITLEEFTAADPRLYFMFDENSDYKVKMYIGIRLLYEVVITHSGLSGIYKYPFNPSSPEKRALPDPYFSYEDNYPYTPSQEDMKAYRWIEKNPQKYIRHELWLPAIATWGDSSKVSFMFRVISKSGKSTDYYESKDYYFVKNKESIIESDTTLRSYDDHVKIYPKSDSMKRKLRLLNQKYEYYENIDLPFIPLQFYGRPSVNFTWDKSDPSITLEQIERDWKYIQLCFNERFPYHILDIKPTTSKRASSSGAKPYFVAYAYGPDPCLTDSDPKLGKEIARVARNNHCFFVSRTIKTNNLLWIYKCNDSIPDECFYGNSITTGQNSYVEYKPQLRYTDCSSFVYDNIDYYDEKYRCFVIPGTYSGEISWGFESKESNGFTFVWKEDYDDLWEYDTSEDEIDEETEEEPETHELIIPDAIQELIDAKAKEVEEDDDDFEF